MASLVDIVKILAALALDNHVDEWTGAESGDLRLGIEALSFSFITLCVCNNF